MPGSEGSEGRTTWLRLGRSIAEFGRELRRDGAAGLPLGSRIGEAECGCNSEARKLSRWAQVFEILDHALASDFDGAFGR
jgi:hypothetical protein